MGIVKDLLLYGVVKALDNRKNGKKKKAFYRIKTDNVILCGGEDVDPHNRAVLNKAGAIKLDTFYEAILIAEKNDQSVIGIYDKNKKPVINTDEIGIHSDYVVFGENASYDPFYNLEESISPREINAFFNRIVKKYCGIEKETSDKTIMNVIRLFVKVLSELGPEYITSDNFTLLAEKLLYKQELEFENWLEEYVGREFTGNLLVEDWNNIQSTFRGFWDTYHDCIDSMNAVRGNRKESLFSAMTGSNLSDGGICLCGLDTGDELMKCILFSELEMINGCIEDFKLVDYYIPLPNLYKEFQFLAQKDVCIIGSTLLSMNLKRIAFPNPTVICLGVKAQDAQDILDNLVATGKQIQFGAGISPAPNEGVHIHLREDSAHKPLTQNDLMLRNVPDGSAYVIDTNGYTFVRNIYN